MNLLDGVNNVITTVLNVSVLVTNIVLIVLKDISLKEPLVLDHALLVNMPMLIMVYVNLVILLVTLVTEKNHGNVMTVVLLTSSMKEDVDNHVQTDISEEMLLETENVIHVTQLVWPVTEKDLINVTNVMLVFSYMKILVSLFVQLDSSLILPTTDVNHVMLPVDVATMPMNVLVVHQKWEPSYTSVPVFQLVLKDIMVMPVHADHVTILVLLVTQDLMLIVLLVETTDSYITVTVSIFAH
jgi:hypothetical protein